MSEQMSAILASLSSEESPHKLASLSSGEGSRRGLSSDWLAHQRKGLASFSKASVKVQRSIFIGLGYVPFPGSVTVARDGVCPLTTFAF